MVEFSFEVYFHHAFDSLASPRPLAARPAAAAIGGAVTTLSRLFLSPADVRFDSAHLHSYAASAFGGAVIAVLAYFKQSPVAPG